METVVEEKQGVEVEFDVAFDMIKEQLVTKAWNSIYNMKVDRLEKCVVKGDTFEHNGVTYLPYLVMQGNFTPKGKMIGWGCSNVGYAVEAPQDFVNILMKMREIQNSNIIEPVYVKSIYYPKSSCLYMDDLEKEMKSLFNYMQSDFELLSNGKCMDTINKLKEDLTGKMSDVKQRIIDVDVFDKMFKEYRENR